MKKLFDIFTSIPHVRAFQESDINSNIGVSMDELVRHQPTLKPGVMKEISAMLDAVLQKCAPEEVSADEMVFCTLQKTRAADAPAPGENNEEDESKDDRKDSLVAQLIEGAARVMLLFYILVLFDMLCYKLLTLAPFFIPNIVLRKFLPEFIQCTRLLEGQRGRSVDEVLPASNSALRSCQHPRVLYSFSPPEAAERNKPSSRCCCSRERGQPASGRCQTFARVPEPRIRVDQVH